MSFSLGDYVTVNERLKAALEKFPDLRVAELPPKMIEAGGKHFVEVQMTVYHIRAEVKQPTRRPHASDASSATWDSESTKASLHKTTSSTANRSSHPGRHS
jgi:hypothetical protein